METIGDRVRARMKLLGFKQKGLAKRCGIDQSQLSRLLSGAVASPSHLYELSLALETSVKWLKTGVEEHTATQAYRPDISSIEEGDRPQPESAIEEVTNFFTVYFREYRKLSPEAAARVKELLKQELLPVQPPKSKKNAKASN